MRPPLPFAKTAPWPRPPVLRSAKRETFFSARWISPAKARRSKAHRKNSWLQFVEVYPTPHWDKQSGFQSPSIRPPQYAYTAKKYRRCSEREEHRAHDLRMSDPNIERLIG